MNIPLGLVLAIAGGIMVGNCMMPLKYVRKWNWENTWLVFSIASLGVIPWLLAFITVPNLLHVYSDVDASSFIAPFLYGAGWGVAQVLFGLAVVRIGMALAFAVTIGLSAALGTLVPIVVLHPEALLGGRGGLIFAGVLLMVGGIALCSWAGRQHEGKRAADTSGSDRRHLNGLWMAIVAGMLAPMLNYSLAFGTAFVSGAASQGASKANAPYAVWPIALAGGLLINAAYSVYLLCKNQSWNLFSPLLPDLALAILMAVLWTGSIAVYGMATTFLGLLGVSIGWAVFQICIIFTANISGWIAGEWHGASREPIQRLGLGLLMLAGATVVIAYGNH